MLDAPSIYPVILSGGSGTRLWPLSRQASPKQFISLMDDDHNLLQKTCLRLPGLVCEPPIIVSNHEHRFKVLSSLEQINCDFHQIILEPCSRNTAPAVALAALSVLQDDPDAVMLVLPADHYLSSTDTFFGLIQQGMKWAQQGYFLTFGVTPSSARTGFGYIERGDMLEPGVFHAARFVEKPDRDRAEAFLQQGGYDWNSGMFLISAKAYCDALKVFQPELYQAVYESFLQSNTDLSFTRVGEDAFSSAPSISIDYAVMERSDRVLVMPLADVTWSDIGTWDALYHCAKKNSDQNVVDGDVYTVDTHHCYLKSKDRLLATAGVEHLIVVETADAILVADRHQPELVKQVTTQLAQDQRTMLVDHQRCHAPWGYFETVSRGDGFLVSRFMLRPQAARSFFVFQHSSIHLVVLSGRLKLVLPESACFYEKGASIMIEADTPFSVTNPEDNNCELLQVQSALLPDLDEAIKVDLN